MKKKNKIVRANRRYKPQVTQVTSTGYLEVNLYP